MPPPEINYLHGSSWAGHAASLFSRLPCAAGVQIAPAPAEQFRLIRKSSLEGAGGYRGSSGWTCPAS